MARYGLELDSVQEKERVIYKKKKKSDIPLLPMLTTEKLRMSSEYSRIFQTYLNPRSLLDLKHKLKGGKRKRSKVSTSFLDRTTNHEITLVQSVDLTA